MQPSGLSRRDSVILAAASCALSICGLIALGLSRREPRTVVKCSENRKKTLDMLCGILQELSDEEWAEVEPKVQQFLSGDDVAEPNTSKPTPHPLTRLPDVVTAQSASQTFAENERPRMTSENLVRSPDLQVDVSRFRTMLKVGVNPDAVKSKMLVEGIDPQILFAGDVKTGTDETSSSSSEEKDNSKFSNSDQAQPKDSRLVKYETMLKVGIHPEAIKTKMKVDGIDPALLFGKEVSAKAAPVNTPLGQLVPCENLATTCIWRSIEHNIIGAQTKLQIQMMFRVLPTKVNTAKRPLNGHLDGSDENISGNKQNKKPTGAKLPKTSSLLPARRAQNLEIGLARFKLDPETICNAVVGMEPEVFGRKDDDNLQLLLHLLPTDEEMKAVAAYEGDESSLTDVERLFRQFALRAPDVTARVEVMIFVVRFPIQVKDLRAEMDIIGRAIALVYRNSSLAKMLELCLEVSLSIVGNTTVQAAGLSIHGLGDKLTKTKTSDAKITASDVVAGMLKQIGVSDGLPVMEPAFATFRSLSGVESDLIEFEKGIQKKSQLEGPNAETCFVETARQEVSSLRSQLVKLRKSFADTLAYFGEPHDRTLNVFFQDLCVLIGSIQASLITNKFGPALLI